MNNKDTHIALTRDSLLDQSLKSLFGRLGAYPVNSVTHCPGKRDAVFSKRIAFQVVIVYQSARWLTKKSCRSFNQWLLFFPASGNRNTDGTVNNTGNNGYFWSGSSNSTTNGFNMNVNSNGANWNTNNNRQNGFPVRCVRAFTTAVNQSGTIVYLLI